MKPGTTLRLLVVGERDAGSSPTLTMTRGLAATGIVTEYSNGIQGRSTRQWIQLVRKADIILVNSYGGPSVYTARQIALACALGCVVIRRWAGTDVLMCLEDLTMKTLARKFDRLVCLNISPAPHLVEELSSVGIRAQLIPALLSLKPKFVKTTVPDVPKTLLVYLPSNRKDFFGIQIIRGAIESNPDIHFVIVADDSHELAKYSNVSSLGWVADMETVWPKVGGVLRNTRHDGMPRILLDGLSRGKYVIYSWNLPGCWYARTMDEVNRAIDRFRHAFGANKEGLEEAKRMLRPDAAETIANLFQNAKRNAGVLSRIRGLTLAIWLTIESKTRASFVAPRDPSAS